MFKKFFPGHSRTAASKLSPLVTVGSASSAEHLSADTLPELVTDQKLLEWYYSKFERTSVQAIATDHFLGKSKSQYCPPWLAREILQNFIDHNTHDPNTLNGVSVQRENHISSESTFRITGRWVFDDPTGLIAPHSDKPDNIRTAGGNGIGLKQVAIRYLRDFHVNEFSIQGEGWLVQYKLASKDMINARLKEAGIEHRLRHDWLIAELKQNDHKGSCIYEIKTGDPHLIASLIELQAMGVSDHNPYLANPDFHNQHGTIKWIMPDASDIKGRLFINGQVFSYQGEGTAENYWRGTEYVSVHVRGVDYKMNIDRPPVNPYDFVRYAGDLIKSMSRQELIEQIKKTHPLWTSDIDSAYSFERPAALRLLELIIKKLKETGFNQSDLEQVFPGNKFVARFKDLQSEQISHLRQEGYVLCPDFFSGLGIPSAKTKLSTYSQAELNKPVNSRNQIQLLSETHGITVFCSIQKSKNIGELLPASLKKAISKVTVSEEQIEIEFAGIKISKNELAHALPNPKTKEQKVLAQVRSLILNGLASCYFDQATTIAGGYLTTYDKCYDSVSEEQTLIARNTEYEYYGELKLRIKASKSDIEKISKILLGFHDDTKSTDNDLSDSRIEVTDSEKDEKLTGRTIRVVPAKVNQSLLEERERFLESVGAIYPQLAEQLNEVNELLKEQQAETTSADLIIQKYLKWRESSDGQYEGTTGSISGASIASIVAQFNEADIAVIEREGILHDDASDKLKFLLIKALNKLSPPDAHVEHFEIVTKPSDLHIQRLCLLRSYVELTSGIAIHNDLFIYDGTGSKGINIGKKAIGLNSALFEESFEEALSTFVHEIAHNFSMDHDYPFMHAMQSLFVKINQRVSEVALKAESDKSSLSKNDQLILGIINQW